MIINSKLKFVTYIPVIGSKPICVMPTVNNITEAVYNKIKDVDCFKEYVKSGNFVIMGRKETSKIENEDINESVENNTETEDVAESYVDVILRVKPAEAIEIIKSTVIKKDLKDALAEEKRPRVKKVIRDQLASLETETTEEKAEETTEENKGMFVD